MNVLGEKINLVSFVIVAQEREGEREREKERGRKCLRANLFMQNEYIFYKWSINRFKYA